MSVLVSVGLPVRAESLAAPAPLQEDSPGQANVSGKQRNDAGFVFEEPLVNGNGKTVLPPSPEPDACLESPAGENLPKVAIIIDDMGHHQEIGGELLGLDLDLTFSFLPHAPFTAEQGERAWNMGRDILVHMPMEPRDSAWDPGEGALYVDESEEKTIHGTRENISRVPHAIGVNNHMGSRFTADRRAMQIMLSVLRERGLFFVDSLTISESVGAEEARTMGLKTGSRVVFLDNIQSQEDICRQLKRLVAYAKKHGSGIAIGHPNRATLSALKLCREMLEKQVRVVGVHELVR